MKHLNNALSDYGNIEPNLKLDPKFFGPQVSNFPIHTKSCPIYYNNITSNNL